LHASPHKNFRSLLACSIVHTFSRIVQFSRSNIPLYSGVSWTVRFTLTLPSNNEPVNIYISDVSSLLFSVIQLTIVQTITHPLSIGHAANTNAEEKMKAFIRAAAGSQHDLQSLAR